MKNILFLGSVMLLSSLLFTSCSNKLTRKKAELLINQKYNLPKQVTEELRHGLVYYSFNPNLSLEDYLIEHGLITFKYLGNTRDMFFTYRQYNLDLTSEGQKYVLSTSSNSDGKPVYLVKVAEKVFGEITGIREINDGKVAEVEFTLKLTNITPFGDAYSHEAQARSNELNLPFYREGETYKMNATFMKYDDGWRIQ